MWSGGAGEGQPPTDRARNTQSPHEEMTLVLQKKKLAPSTWASWGVTKTIRPEHRGAIKLTRVYGEKLFCVRYRENASRDERITTVELIVERVVIQKRKDEIVSFKIKHDEEELRRAAKAKGATFDGKTKMWKLARREILRLGLRNRIAMSTEELLREHEGR